jgi:hypothetical protein
MTSDSGAPAQLNLPGMLDMSSSMPIFTTPSEIFSWACAANAHASSSAAPDAMAADLFILTSRGLAFLGCQPRHFATEYHISRPADFDGQRCDNPIGTSHGWLCGCSRNSASAISRRRIFGAVRTVDDRERFYHDDPLRALEPGQPLEATRPQGHLVQFHPVGRPNEDHRHGIGPSPRGRHHLDTRHGLSASPPVRSGSCS